MKNQNSNYKIKLLLLYDILRRETDEDHPLSTYQLIDKLKEKGISCDRKVLYDDINQLNEYGYEVLSTRGRSNMYFISEPFEFSDVELKILIDSINAARFLTEKKSKELTNKVLSLAGSHKSEILMKTIKSINIKKNNNEKIYYAINNIFEAIVKKKKISFLYFERSPKGERVIRNNGKEYVYTPIDIFINEDYYYLIALSDNHEDATIFRIDRMDNVVVTEEKAKRDNININDIRKKAFSMYWGEEEPIIIQFHRNISNQVYDKFVKPSVKQINEDWYQLESNVIMSASFFAWCFSLGQDLKIVGPSSLIEEYKIYLSNAMNQV